jgi:sorbitol-specific phosphotransferase system component IIC
MINFMIQLTALIFILLTLTAGTEIIGQTYLNRKLNKSTKQMIFIFTLLNTILIIGVCIQTYLNFKY